MTKQTPGYTLIEMVVVVAVFGLLAGGATISFMISKKKQNTVILQSQTVTLLRRLQSAALSSKDLPDGKSAGMYVLKIVSGSTPSLVVQGFDNSESSPVFYQNIETMSVPSNAVIDDMTVIRKDGTSISPAKSCVQVGFLIPFGKVYIDESCSNTGGGINQTIQSQYNLANIGDRILRIPIRSSDNTYQKTIEINGISGVVSVQ
jgi:prepilin-type N-terminal cleavage/methylation domain-containing protein